jgi:uncharacterized membrane protein
MSSTDRLVSDYLDRLESELSGIPRAGRREVMDGIEAHIEEAVAELEPYDEVGVRNLLDRLGEPTEIAAEAADRFGVRRQKASWREISALILLPFGGLILPFFGWFVGVILLWISDAWTARDKVIGTVVIPGGLLVPFFLLTGVGSGSGTGGGTPIWPAIILYLLVLAPLVTDGYLLWRLRRRTA